MDQRCYITFPVKRVLWHEVQMWTQQHGQDRCTMSTKDTAGARCPDSIETSRLNVNILPQGEEGGASIAVREGHPGGGECAAGRDSI
ncbi:hypothetical protein DPEC_G00098920 [Dallia pectoralis]|uniref:Uncharacterized protein n=1 Tax=Dallia pectoralis TaxID=75939 RepID=A0ACC2GVY6_DALPE|nr:hypothetical protein DPEC_G00098920 [Dallia pectoralis]